MKALLWMLSAWLFAQLLMIVVRRSKRPAATDAPLIVAACLVAHSFFTVVSAVAAMKWVSS